MFTPKEDIAYFTFNFEFADDSAAYQTYYCIENEDYSLPFMFLGQRMTIWHFSSSN